MAKAKGKKGAPGGAQSHIRSRISYLHRAAAYLQSAPTDRSREKGAGETKTIHDDPPLQAMRTVPELIEDDGIGKEMQSPKPESPKASSLHLVRHYISQMRGVSLKTQLRLPIEVKRSFCKRCDILLVPDVTCVEEIQNASRDRKKPWADVRVIRCTACGTEKRFPQNQKRSKKLAERKKEVRDQPGVS
jgi:ribonuclease P protein subunit RPR2